MKRFSSSVLNGERRETFRRALRLASVDGVAGGGAVRTGEDELEVVMAAGEADREDFDEK